MAEFETVTSCNASKPNQAARPSSDKLRPWKPWKNTDRVAGVKTADGLLVVMVAGLDPQARRDLTAAPVLAEALAGLLRNATAREGACSYCQSGDPAACAGATVREGEDGWVPCANVGLTTSLAKAEAALKAAGYKGESA